MKKMLGMVGIFLMINCFAIGQSADRAVTAKVSAHSVALSWTASSNAGTSPNGTLLVYTYNLYRGTAAGAEGSTAYQTGITGVTFNDTAVTPGATYYYQVSGTCLACNPSGESPKSGESLPALIPLPLVPALAPGTPVITSVQ